MSEIIVKAWLTSFADTAVKGQLKEHMAHISTEVMVFGVPGFDTIKYSDWYSQCESEFPQQLIRELGYSSLIIRTSNDQDIKFNVMEHVTDKERGTVNHPLEMIIKNVDGKWLLMQLRIMQGDEAVQAGRT